jgi:hypothetical protein
VRFGETLGAGAHAQPGGRMILGLDRRGQRRRFGDGAGRPGGEPVPGDALAEDGIGHERSLPEGWDDVGAAERCVRMP